MFKFDREQAILEQLAQISTQLKHLEPVQPSEWSAADKQVARNILMTRTSLADIVALDEANPKVQERITKRRVEKRAQEAHRNTVRVE